MYYRVDESIDEKIIGCPWPQVKDTIYPINIWDPRFIKFYLLKPLDNEAIAAIPVIKSTAKLTDLLSASNNGTSFRLTVSDKLKILFEFHLKGEFEFFPISIQHKGIFKQGYWLTNILHTDNEECLDYKLSEIFKQTDNPLNDKQIICSTHQDLLDFIKANSNAPGPIGITKPVVRKGVNKNILILDYVKEGGLIYCVSEKLKAEIEAAGCTGLVFHPIEQAV